MPGFGNDEEWSNVKLIIGCGLLLLLIVAVWRWCLRGSMRTVRAVALQVIPKSLKRGAPSVVARALVNRNFAEKQVEAFRRYAPGDTDSTLQTLQDEVLVAGAEMHARHITPDSLLRAAVLEYIRAPRAELLAAMRRVFEAMGAHTLLALWDDTVDRLRGIEPRRWYTTLGRERVKALRKALNNATEQLFLSESQGNLMTGTHLDVTPDTIALLGRARVTAIVRSTLKLIDAMGLEPQLRLVEGEIMLGHSASVGALYHYGYRSNRTHDKPSDPLALLTWKDAERVVSNSGFKAKVRYLWSYHPWLLLALLIGLFILGGRLIKWPRW